MRTRMKDCASTGSNAEIESAIAVAAKGAGRAPLACASLPFGRMPAGGRVPVGGKDSSWNEVSFGIPSTSERSVALTAAGRDRASARTTSSRIVSCGPRFMANGTLSGAAPPASAVCRRPRALFVPDCMAAPGTGLAWRAPSNNGCSGRTEIAPSIPEAGGSGFGTPASAPEAIATLCSLAASGPGCEYRMGARDSSTARCDGPESCVPAFREDPSRKGGPFASKGRFFSKDSSRGNAAASVRGAGDARRESSLAASFARPPVRAFPDAGARTGASYSCPEGCAFMGELAPAAPRWTIGAFPRMAGFVFCGRGTGPSSGVRRAGNSAKGNDLCPQARAGPGSSDASASTASRTAGFAAICGRGPNATSACSNPVSSSCRPGPCARCAVPFPAFKAVMMDTRVLAMIRLGGKQGPDQTGNGEFPCGALTPADSSAGR